ncbi:hypothetical protein OGAPHI_006106 [Ogataea philodendri]|uniref:Uncharacterized protein n=1 Tax=Ogataea philodendri TaxID=1378263 RepID=A0A9P8NYP6_9ASCO|nr:uncharacterized protein OGAPHI_006106 [Ogataea philodendri]KAH3661927.1 hypothetical protein OGAPHI_006106 [Ogataea philodendri]
MSAPKSLVLMTEDTPKELPHYALPTYASIRKSKTNSPLSERPKTVRATGLGQEQGTRLGSPRTSFSQENKTSAARSGLWNLFRKVSDRSQELVSGDENDQENAGPTDLKDRIFTTIAPKRPARLKPLSLFEAYAQKNPDVIEVADSLAKQAQTEIDQSENTHFGAATPSKDRNRYFVAPEVLFKSVGNRSMIPVAEHLDLLHNYSLLWDRVHLGR